MWFVCMGPHKGVGSGMHLGLLPSTSEAGRMAGSCQGERQGVGKESESRASHEQNPEHLEAETITHHEMAAAWDPVSPMHFPEHLRGLCPCVSN